MQDLEFTISQYLDGGLPPADRTALESRLTTDADARALLDQYRRLNSAMKSMPMPAFEWGALSKSISAAVDAAHEESMPRSYRMPAWIRMAAMPLALAASLLIVAGVGIQIFNSHQTSPKGWPAAATPSSVQATSATYVAFETDKVAGPVEENIAIGPSSPAINFADDPAPGPSHVTVVSGVTPAHDISPASSFDME